MQPGDNHAAVRGEPLDTVLRVETPELIAFEFRLAGPWKRMWAFALDLLIRAGLLVAMGMLAAASEAWGFEGAILFLAWFGLEWFYHVLFEWLWDGATPGKKAVGLKVVREGGQSIGFGESMLRNLLRAADLLPSLAFFPTYLLGLTVSAGDRHFRRLGDLAAGTVVVVDERLRLRRPAPIVPPPAPGELDAISPHLRLSAEARRTIDAFVQRIEWLSPGRREEICGDYARALADRLGLPRPASGARFLQLVHARLSGQAGPPGASR